MSVASVRKVKSDYEAGTIDLFAMITLMTSAHVR